MKPGLSRRFNIACSVFARRSANPTRRSVRRASGDASAEHFARRPAAGVHRTSRGKGFVLVSNLSDMKVTAAVDVSVMKPRALDWANEDTLLLLASETVDFGAQARQVESFAPYGIDLSGELNARQLLLAEQSIRAASQTFGGIMFLQGAQLVGFDRSKGLVLFPRRVSRSASGSLRRRREERCS